MALQYSGAAEGKPLPMVLEIVVGPVNRGACIRDLSQYPLEVEYLYLPMSFISPDGTPRFTISAAGLGVRVIPVRINVNLSARTVEEFLKQKKRMHCTSFRFLLGELKGELARLAVGSGTRFAGDLTRDQVTIIAHKVVIMKVTNGARALAGDDAGIAARGNHEAV